MLAPQRNTQLETNPSPCVSAVGLDYIRPPCHLEHMDFLYEYLGSPWGASLFRRWSTPQLNRGIMQELAHAPGLADITGALMSTSRRVENSISL